MTGSMSSSGQASPEDYDAGSRSMHEESWVSQQAQDGLDPGSPSMESNAGTSSMAKAPTPMQKRRRVTRACDECRRKKIKCDGKQPCTHCTVYSYDCTYDQPSNRRRNPAPQYVEALEQRLQRAEALLKSVMPEADLSSPTVDAVLSQRTQSIQSAASGSVGAGQPFKSSGEDQERDAMLESMIETTGLLDLDDQGCWDFRGHSSGLSFMRKMRQQFGDLMGPEASKTTPFIKTRPMSQIFDSPTSASQSPRDSTFPPVADLPPRSVAQGLCGNALDDATGLLIFVHQPSFYSMFNKIYDISPDNWGTAENRFLPLLYSVMALGSMFAKSEQSDLERGGYENAIDQGFKYFRAARHIMDITDVRDLTSLQAVVFMILFLQSSAKLSTCYSYIGIALRSAMRLGLHRSLPIQFNPIERETRKKTFWAIRKMDVYVSAILGLPQNVRDDDIDQEFPVEVDDEYLTDSGILPMPEGELSRLAGSNSHTKLVRILGKVIEYVYPLKGVVPNNGSSNRSYVVSYTKIQEIERDLQEWLDALPLGLRPGGDSQPELERIQHLLRMSYAHVQLLLYRPFLHYVAQGFQGRGLDKRSYACAAACVSVSRNIIHITTEMKKRGLLIGSYWFTMYTTFFAIMSLVFFMLENVDSPTSLEMMKDVNEGRETLASMARRSMAADRCTATLTNLFKQLPEHLTRGRTKSLSDKKRQARSPAASAQSRMDSPHTSPPLKKEPVPLIRRASTFPVQPGGPVVNRSGPYEVNGVPGKPNLDTNLGRSYDNYTPEAGMPTPDSAFASLSPQQQQQFNLQKHLSGFSDLSAMMFPSADPFAYPNQPMTTLENKHYQDEPFQLFENMNTPNAFPPNTSTPGVPYDNNMEVQLFGPLPPFLMHGQQPGTGMHQQQQQQHMDPAVSMAMGNMNQGHFDEHNRPVHPQGMNLEDIFGTEDWNGMMMEHGYRQQ